MQKKPTKPATKAPADRKPKTLEGLDQPTRDGVRTLLNELTNRARYSVPMSKERNEALAEMKRMKDEVLQSPQYVVLKKQVDAIESEREVKRNRLTAAVTRVRNQFQATGVTAKVKEDLLKLLELLDAEAPLPDGSDPDEEEIDD